LAIHGPEQRISAARAVQMMPDLQAASAKITQALF